MIRKVWHRLFLEERPSISLSLFRIAVALTVGVHVMPSFVHLDDTFLSTALKTLNTSFFTREFVELVQKSPDTLVIAFVWLFMISWFLFLIGLFSQISCIALTCCCYYFYALNSFPIGTLSWDILLVTMFLMCLTAYHGDYFSMDALRRQDAMSYRRLRPFFLQRLLQLQIASTFFYTALYKITAQGNWLKDNPILYLMNTPPEGVIKHFMFKEILAADPHICYTLGVMVVICELLLPFLLFFPFTRIGAIYAGFMFHLTLILTMDVPAIFFFLFPPQLCLFIHPGKIAGWIEQKRRFNQSALRPKLLYDGQCRFCRLSVRQLAVMDLFAAVDYVDFHTQDLTQFRPQLTKETAASQIHLVEREGGLHGGFFALRRLCWMMPMLYPLIPLVYFPGARLVGPVLYRCIAQNRYFLHFNHRCRDNRCFRQ